MAKQISVLGMGPGDRAHMTEEALEVVESSDVIIGYTSYIRLLQKIFPAKHYEMTGMHEEKERCIQALHLAREGQQVCLVSSGDAGVYGMASLLYELAQDCPDVEIQVVPGITAALSGAALLGAPLGHDFTVISLSDLLTPWEQIEKRVRLAAQGDFVICLYNPGSHTRRDRLRRAADLVLEYQAPETVCGIARHIAREGQSVQILTLGELREVTPDMLMTVFIGSSQTRVISGRMVTPRGYHTGA